MRAIGRLWAAFFLLGICLVSAAAWAANNAFSGGQFVTAETDKSGTITAGGVAQSLMVANPSRMGCDFQNISNGDLWLNTKGGTAAVGQPNRWLPAGAAYRCDPENVPTGAFSIFGATTGQAFTATEYRR